MRQIVESLKRLFESGQIDEEKINALLKRRVINIDERRYILQLQ